MTLKYGSEGKKVEALQMALLRLGYPLPKWGADGDLGFETWAAVRSFGLNHGKKLPDGVKGAEVPDNLVVQIVTLAAAVTPSNTPPNFFDVTGDHSGKQRRGTRSWQRVSGIVLHQTAVLLGPKVERWYDVAAHVGIPTNGKIIQINPLEQLIWHANSLNDRTVGIEISGNFEGIDGNPKTYWKPGGGPQRATAAQLQAARDAVQWICDEIAARGGAVRYIFAHRQASEERRADPGSRVWEHVGLWGQSQLGLSDGGPGYKVGTGAPIPRDWDPNRTERY